MATGKGGASALSEPANAKRGVREWVAQLKQAERRYIMVPLQTHVRFAGFRVLMLALGEACTGDGLVVLFALLNWCVSNRWGTEGIWLVPVAEILNGLIKWRFRSPRPGWVDKSVVQMGLSHEYSFPSSHSMISFSLAVYFAHELQSGVPYAVASMVAFSRVYEGMHYPHDVAVGSLLGTALGHGLLVALQVAHASNFLQRGPAVQVIGAGLAAVAVVVAAVVMCYHAVEGAPLDAVWSDNVRKVLKGQPLQPHRVPYLAYIGMTGVLGGLTVGETYFYRGEGFEMPKSATAGLARLVVGLAVLLGCFFGVRAFEKAVEPRSILLALVLRFFRFFQVPLIILLVAPPVFAALSI